MVADQGHIQRSETWLQVQAARETDLGPNKLYLSKTVEKHCQGNTENNGGRKLLLE